MSGKDDFALMMEGVCASCLSIGRNLHSLGTDLLLYQSLLADNQEYQTCAGPVCWECKAVLVKVRRFRARARLAETFLRGAHFNSSIVCSPKNTLSTLGAHPIIECNLQLKSESGDDINTEPPSPASDRAADDADYEVEEHVRIKVEPSDAEGHETRSKTRGKRKVNIKVKRKNAPKVLKGVKMLKGKDKKLKEYARKTPIKIKTKKEMSERFKTLRMSEADMLKGRQDDRGKSFYVKAPYKCESCVYGYYREARYRDHVAEKHSNSCGDYVCPVCASRFPKPNLLQSHARRHYRLYRCRACGFQHRDVKHMLRHYETQHETDKNFQCSDCDQVFPRYYVLRYHRESCHRDSTKCEHCGKVLSSRTNYRRHLMLHTGMPSRQCPVCQKTFRGDELYKSHQRVHLTEPAPDAYCAECNVHFKHMYIYRQHLKYSLKHITPDLLKFPCTMCERRFRQQGHLKRHFDAVHLKKTKFVCPHCSKNICSKGALRTHVRSVHEKVPAKKDKVCDICARTFATKATLDNHIRTHTGERPFRCSVCGATFGHSSALWTHNKLVHLKLKKTVKLSRAAVEPPAKEERAEQTMEEPAERPKVTIPPWLKPTARTKTT